MKQISLTEYIRQIIKEIKLTEDMKSEKLRKLTKYLPKNTGWRGITDKFKIALDQVTDDQVQVVKGPQAKGILSKNPAAIGFFIWNGDTRYGENPKGLMGVKQGTKFVSFTNYQYSDYPNRKDSSAVRGYQRKGGSYDSDSGIRRTTGSSRVTGQGKYSKGGHFSPADYWSDDVIVYIINTAEIGGATTDKKATRAGNVDVFKTTEQIRNTNKSRYTRAIAAMRATKDPEFITEYQQKLDVLNAQVNSSIQKILANPAKFKYAGIDHQVTYGSGRDQRTYTTSLLKLVTEVYGAFDDMIASYKKSGWRDESDAKRDFNSKYNQIMKLVKSINAKAEETK